MASIEMIPTAELKFDPLNPRIPVRVDPGDDAEVLRWMLSEAGLVELMGSIAANGFFAAEPLLVTPATDGGYWVLEGNRRLAAVRLLLDPDQATKRSQAVQQVAGGADLESLVSLPCVIFDSRERVMDYLGFRHITGVKAWEPAAKARYLRALYEEHAQNSGDDVYRRIARIIGSRSDYVMRLLASLHLYDRIGDLGVLHDAGLDDDEISFSLITLALNYRSIQDFLGLPTLAVGDMTSLDADHLGELAEWMFVPAPELGRSQLGDSRNMKWLAAAIGNERGLEALRAGASAEDAAANALESADLLARALKSSHLQLDRAIKLVAKAQVDEHHATAFEEIEELAAAGRRQARRKIRESEEAAGV
ncbi:MAG: ParB N-terminal domain-containing protein [Microbacteriaceae bacterium]